MTDLIRRYEIYILRPLQGFFIGAFLIALIKGIWLLLVVYVISIFFLGIIGSQLHPLQSFSDLSQGPLDNPVAKIESEGISDSGKRVLVNSAITKTAFLVGIATMPMLWVGFGWHWYYALFVAYLISALFGGFLKNMFILGW